MKNKALYITVRLDIEYEKTLDWEEVKQEVISECSYNFHYRKLDRQPPLENEIIEITNTEICGENEL